MVLSHLILNDMMKVKGHVARLALCLQDDVPRIAGLAQVFFHELSRKAFKVGAFAIGGDAAISTGFSVRPSIGTQKVLVASLATFLVLLGQTSELLCFL